MAIIVFNEKYYLQNNLSFTINIEEAEIIEIEEITIVSVHTCGKLVRIKVGDKYISVNDNKEVLLTSIKNDNTLLIYHCDKIISVQGALTVQNNKLIVENILITEEPKNINKLCLIYDNRIYQLLFQGITTISSTYNLEQAAQLVHESPHTRISNLFELNSNLFWKLLNDPALHSILKKIFPNSYHCTTFSSNNLHKGVDESGWHCDYPYHNMEFPYPKETLGVQVIWTLDDFTENNGATYFVSGSHKLCKWPSENVEGVRQAICPKGNIIIFFGKLWHTQGINLTNFPRAALLANFSPLNIPAKDFIKDYVPSEFITDGQVRFY